MEQNTYQLNFNEDLLHPAADEIVRPVYTLPLHEQRLFRYCQENGIRCYLPLKRVWQVCTRSYKNRQYQYSHEVLRPMFTSYAFVKMTAEQRGRLYLSNSVARILSIADEDKFFQELRTVHCLELAGLTEELTFNDVKEGDRFYIDSGPWEGSCGWLMKKEKRFKWTVEIECVNTVVSATIDPSMTKMHRADA